MLSYEVPYVRKILDLGEETPQLPINSSPQHTVGRGPPKKKAPTSLYRNGAYITICVDGCLVATRKWLYDSHKCVRYSSITRMN
jgi:hypothetical protein